MTGIERIILIDDNEDDNEIHEYMIRRAGFTGEVCLFESGAAALAFLQNDAMALRTIIFLDINMPRMDGFEVARRLTPLLEGRTSTLLMFLTSSASPQDRQQAADIPVIQGFVTKPLTRELIQGYLGKPSLA